MTEQLWLLPAEAAPVLGYKKLDALYRDIREHQFPFRFVKLGKRIRICARSIGLIPEAQTENAPSQAESLPTQAAA